LFFFFLFFFTSKRMRVQEQQVKGTVNIPLGVGDVARKHGVKLRQQLYAFRIALEKAGHPHAQLCKSMGIRLIEEGGTWKLEIASSGNLLKGAILEQAEKQKLPDLSLAAIEAATNASASLLPTVGSPANETPEKFNDPMEIALEKLGYFTGVKTREQK
jgi:hypothetical protein